MSGVVIVWSKDCKMLLPKGNIAPLLSDIMQGTAPLLLINSCILSRFGGMRHTCFLSALVMVLALAAPPAAASCYADYKAKQDNPLRLHYGVAAVSQCSKKAAQRELRGRLAAHGWTLLNVVSVFDQSGLAKRKNSAGPNYLRY